MKDAGTPADAVSWQALMEAMVIGAVRGMAEGHARIAADGAPLQPLNEISMLQAAELLIAMLLEESTDCARRGSWPDVADLAGQRLLTHLEGFRRQREKAGQATLFKILDRAGLNRQGMQ